MSPTKLVYILVTAVLHLGASARAADKYAGSESCKECHATRYAGWSEGLHARLVRPINASGQPLPTEAEAAAAPFRLSEAQYALGNMYRLVFLKKSGQGLELLPVEFDVGKRSWAPLSLHLWDPAASGTPKAEAEEGARNWNLRCARCHTTGFEAATHSYSELSIGCEACHGPGGAHVASKGKERLTNPETLPAERGNHVCAQCHSNGLDKASGHPFPTGYRPGDDLGKTFTFSLPTPQVETALFTRSGSSRRHHAQYNEHLQSKHFESGLRCFDCHLVHRAKTVEPSKNTRLVAWTERFLLKRVAQGTCSMCHRPGSISVSKRRGAKEAEVDGHTRHPVVVTKRTPASAAQPKGGREQERLLCGECHMPSSLREDVGYTLTTHTFKPPTPSNNRACMGCHEPKGEAWVEQQLGLWQGQAQR